MVKIASNLFKQFADYTAETLRTRKARIKSLLELRKCSKMKESQHSSNVDDTRLARRGKEYLNHNFCVLYRIKNDAP